MEPHLNPWLLLVHKEASMLLTIRYWIDVEIVFPEKIQECLYNSLKINKMLKENLTKLSIETGSDWVCLLPYSLYKARNTPYTLGLTFLRYYTEAAPMLHELQSDILAECDQYKFF